jgi:hypothetical protein
MIRLHSGVLLYIKISFFGMAIIAVQSSATNINQVPEISTQRDFYEDLAFCCGKCACCLVGSSEDSRRHECPGPIRDMCIITTIGGVGVFTALLVGGAISYVPACSGCFFPSYQNVYLACSPDCQSHFMATFGAMEAATVLPAFPPNCMYCCAHSLGKEQFKQKFKEGQSCLPEHGCSFRNMFLGVAKFFNFCCGPSEDLQGYEITAEIMQNHSLQNQ